MDLIFIFQIIKIKLGNFRWGNSVVHFRQWWFGWIGFFKNSLLNETFLGIGSSPSSQMALGRAYTLEPKSLVGRLSSSIWPFQRKLYKYFHLNSIVSSIGLGHGLSSTPYWAWTTINFIGTVINAIDWTWSELDRLVWAGLLCSFRLHRVQNTPFSDYWPRFFQDNDF